MSQNEMRFSKSKDRTSGQGQSHSTLTTISAVGSQRRTCGSSYHAKSGFRIGHDVAARQNILRTGF